MRALHISYRYTRLLVVIVSGCLLTLLIPRQHSSPRSLSNRVTRWWHQSIIDALGVKLIVHGKPSTTAALLVANHLSWLDIHVIGSQLPVRFLAKAEVKTWPLFGWLASRAGTLYIQRGNKNAATEANRVMQTALTGNQYVVLFPESTTGDGEIKRFHGRLMQSAIDAECLLQPVALRYPDDSDNNLHRSVAYLGDMSFIQSIKNVITTNNIIAELHFLPVIEACNLGRNELAQYAQSQVTELLKQHPATPANS